MSCEPQCPSADSLNVVRMNQKRIPSAADSCCSHRIHSSNRLSSKQPSHRMEGSGIKPGGGEGGSEMILKEFEELYVPMSPLNLI